MCYSLTLLDLTIIDYYGSFRQQNQSLLQSVSSFSRAPPPPVDTKQKTAHRAIELDQNDYPAVRTWQKAVYVEMSKADGVTKAKTSSDGRKYTPSAFLFVEDEDGVFPTEEEVSSIKAYASDAYFDIARQGLAPQEGWSTAGLRAKNLFRSLMEEKFPNLRLCSGGWKTDWIATYTYPNWKTSHGHKFLAPVVKPEPVMSDDEEHALHVTKHKKPSRAAADGPSEQHQKPRKSSKRKHDQTDPLPSKRRNTRDDAQHLNEGIDEPELTDVSGAKGKAKIVSFPSTVCTST